MRRRVRATPEFFDQLDRRLPSERPARGSASRSDFEADSVVGQLLADGVFELMEIEIQVSR